MTEEIIGMDDMMAVYEVTDLFGIDRESISVPLEKEGSGSVEGRPGGEVQVTVPATTSVREWLPTLRARLLEAGFELQEAAEDEWP